LTLDVIQKASQEKEAMAEQITRLEFAQEQQDGRLMEHRMENLFFRWKMLG